MTVTKETAVATMEYEGETYGFCAQYCHDLFTKNPEKFTEEKTETKSHSHHDHHHVHSNQAQETDPVCGMAVDPENASGKEE